LGKEAILHDVDLDVGSGTFISLLGPSGCGKTTLLKSIAGLLEPASGHIYIQSMPVDRMAPERRGAVIVFQDLRLFPHMTVEKNIGFAMEIQKVSKDTRRQVIQKLLEEVGLPGYEKKKIGEMSGGQMQRVALARALAARPRVLLLDEPFSGLDEALRQKMGELVRHLHRKHHLTTILVTHDKQEALRLSDRIAVMAEGKILQYDYARKVFDYPADEQVGNYLGKTGVITGKVLNGRFCCDKQEWETDQEDGLYEIAVSADGTGFTYFPKQTEEGAE